MKQVDFSEAREHLSELIERVIQGEEVVIARDDRPLVRLVSVTETKRRRQFGSARD